MTPPPDNRQHVRRVVLPSGRTIEVVYFHDRPLPGADTGGDRAATTTRELHRCERCDSGLVYPTEWEEAGPTHWAVELRCPNCEWAGAGVYAQDEVEAFDQELDRGTDSLVRDLKRLMHANMEDEIDRFMRALEADQILPMDF